MNSYVKPDLIVAQRIISEGVKKGELIVLIADCNVKYEGRAYSKLDRGERLIIIKPDRTVLIHRAAGRNPNNWVKDGASINQAIINDELIINAESINPRERLIITCFKVLIINSVRVNDTGESFVSGSEADMSQMLYDNPQIISDNFKPVSLEEQTKYGFIDVMGYDNDTLVIVECKRVTAGLNAVQQLRRYVERVMKSKGLTKVKGVIAAPGITKNAELMLKDFGYKFIRVEPPNRNLISKDKQRSLNDFYKKI